MTTLTRELRRLLESTVREARRIAEAGALKAIEQLAVAHHEPWPRMTPAQRELRNRLRAHGRQLGDRRDEQRGSQAIDRLKAECAYEHWHRLLFARFLAETELLIEPQSGIAITLAECEELARHAGRDWLEVAAEYAQRMLPQIFRNGDPVLEVALPPETRSAIEDLMKALPREVFVAEDSLGWVYQHWQADRKEEVNQSEKKVGADELPSVTQLFTEDYMVLFLLHNTLGAWWAGKVLEADSALAASAATESDLRAACAVGEIEWTYLRFVRGGEGVWRPAAGTFDGWPKAVKDITLLDPCMGSGHFLVFALPILAAMRAAEEKLSTDAAIEAVLRDNLFGMEIDPRCTQIAAFNLALAAWRRLGFRPLPPLHLACSGLSLGVTKVDWLKLAERATAELAVPPKMDLLGIEDNLFSDATRRGFERLYDTFSSAPWLGSLIELRGTESDLIEQGFVDLEPVLSQVMARADSAELAELAVAAQGLAKASEILAGRFTLVATNVPYLGRGKQDDVLSQYCETRHPNAKADLSTCFVERCLDYCAAGGSAALVTPQNWLFLTTYKRLREALLTQGSWNVVARLGPNAFQDMNWWAATTALLVLTNARPSTESELFGIDVSADKQQIAKARMLCGEIVNEISIVHQASQLKNPDARVTLTEPSESPLLQTIAKCLAGILNGDSPKFQRMFWEFDAKPKEWVFQQSTVEETCYYGGRSLVVYFDDENGHLREDAEVRRDRLHDSDQRGNAAWGRRGVCINQMNSMPVTVYTGEKFDSNVAVISPASDEHVAAIWCFVRSTEFRELLRNLDSKVNVTNATIAKVPFDLSHWEKVAIQEYPDGLPEPSSNDPTQWLFNGHPKGSRHPLHVAVARLLGYQWPRQTGSSFRDCLALGSDGLEEHGDPDGIVSLSAVKGEQPASTRLNALLACATGSEWSAAKLDGLLSQVGFAGRSLDDWLHEGFFEQHTALFHHRPFVWHIWDGRRDGFNALVDYHRLVAPDGEGRRTLERLLYSYLGDWIDRQRSEQRAGVEGADARVTAAENLRAELTKILTGEPPYDIFVRWKPLHQLPLGWEPDVNDGVRMNIRPFMAAKPLGARARGACILRTTPKIKWDKDRGKDPQRPREDFPWFWNWDEQTADFEGRGKEPDGNRWNDLHYTRAFKEGARVRKGERLRSVKVKP